MFGELLLKPEKEFVSCPGKASLAPPKRPLTFWRVSFVWIESGETPVKLTAATA